MSQLIDRNQGRQLFGADPDNYERIRPPYPERVYQILVESGGLYPGASAFEVGAGNGLATRRILELGADPVVALEPDERFHPLLRNLAEATQARLTVVSPPFEEVELPEASFDLGLAATAFHWIDQAAGLNKVGRLLKPGGIWAMWWNVFGDPEREDRFHEATRELLQSLAVSPSDAPNAIPFALDTTARLQDIAACGSLSLVHVEVLRWSITLNAEQVRSLYSTFSQFQLLPPAERAALLDRLADVAETQFDGAVERNMTTPVYIAKRLI